jgi:1,4-alpha-glucan branching enzyme
MDDRAQSVFAFLRFGAPEDAPVLVVCNFTPVPRPFYRIGVPEPGTWLEIFNSDAAIYGGSNLGNGGAATAHDHPSHGQSSSLSVMLPPLATVIFKAGR